MSVDLLDAIEKAQEYAKTKSITTAVECAKILKEWVDQPLEVNVVRVSGDEGKADD